MSEPAIALAITPAPIVVLIERADARAFLWWAGLIETIPAAADPLQEYAARSGLVGELGHDRVQQIIANAFAPYRGAGDE